MTGQAQLDHSAHRADAARLPLRIVAHNLVSPENVGGLFRLADALAVEKLYLCGETPCPPNRRIHKVSRATVNAVAWQKVEQPVALLQQLRQAGYRIISLELTTASVDLAELGLQANDKVCLIVGAEKHGVAQELLDASDCCAHIPMRGRNSSMNVAMACAIATYEITQQMIKAV